MRWIDVGALALLCTAQALPYASSELGQDAIRDLLVVEKILREQHLPLAGPGFNMGAFTLGPVWFYVLALPSVFGATPAVSAFFVGALASLKLPLAFRLGLLIDGRWLAWCLVAAICWPSVQAYQWFWWSSPNLVETCLWGYGLTLARALQAKSPRTIDWIAPAAILALAVHAHPTALLYAPTILPAWWVWQSKLEPTRSRSGALSLLAILAGFLVWFIPALLAPDGSPSDGSPSASRPLLDFVRAASARGWQLVPVVRSVFWSYPMAAWQTWQPTALVGPDVVAVGIALWLAAIIAGLALAGRAPTEAPHARTIRRCMAGAAALAGVGLPIVAVLRPWVAFYTTFAIMPAINAVQAGALWMLRAHGKRWSTAAAALACGTSLAGSLWLGFGASRADVAGLANLPLAPLGNLLRDAPTGPLETLRVRQTPLASERVARWVCENDVDAVHGTIALAMAAEHGLFHQRFCESMSHPLVLGQEGERHAVGVPLEWLRLAGRPPLLDVHGLGLVWARAAPHPARGTPVSSDFRYFEQVFERRSAPVDVRLRFAVPADSAVLITSLKPWTGSTQIRRVSRNGTDLLPAARSALGGLWLGTRSGKGAEVARRPASDEWRIEIRTDVPQWIDVVAF